MNSGTLNESTFAQSGARPTRAFSSSRACSVVLIESGMMLTSRRHSGCSRAHFSNSFRKPSAWAAVGAWWE